MKNRIIVVLLTCVSLFFVASDCSNENNGTGNPPSSNDIGVIMTTDDAGETWLTRNVSLGAAVTLICSFPVDMDTFCIVVNKPTTNEIMKTTDSGNSFLSVYTTSNAITDITGTINEGTAFAIVNNGSIVKTTNYGSNWNEVFADTNRYLKVIEFANDVNGIILCSSGTLITTDGGLNWLPRPVISGSSDVKDISFIRSFPGTELAACTGNGKIFRSIDLGNNWEEINSPVNENLYAIDFIDPVGIIAGAQNVILRSTDRGMNWVTVPSPNYGLVKNICAESSYYWVLTVVDILRSVDQGQTWINIDPESLIGYNDGIFSKNQAILVGSRIR